MPNYFPNGVEIFPGIIFDPAYTWGLGIKATSTQLALIANPNSTSAIEALLLSTAGALTLGGTSTGVTIAAAATFSTSVTITDGAGLTISSGIGLTVSAAGQTGQLLTGLLSLTLSTYAPAALAASTGRIDKTPSTGLTLSTNDLIFGVTLPSTWASVGVGITNAFPTSSGGLGFNWVNATTGSVTPSTGTYVTLIARTT